jgi:cytochrome P450/NADPH-cytochrome P450 reductase
MASLGGAIGKPIMAAVHQDSKKESNGVLSQKQEQPITILYGSQAGTCKTYAEELESNASRYGFKASVRTLDSATESIPKDEPIVIVSPSYEGQPADNAKKFVKWLEANQSSANMLEGVKYAVFGVGNSDWGTTFHRIPKLLDDLFEKMGAKRFTKTGFVDVKYDIIDPWEAWVQNMWEDVRKASGTIIEVTDDDFKAEISAPKFVTHLGGADIGYGVVKINKDLGGSEVGLAKKHMEIELPVGTGYRAGKPLRLALQSLRDISLSDHLRR